MAESSDTSESVIESGETSELFGVIDENEEPPKYSSRICSPVTSDPPPPPYEVPLEQPPAYEPPAGSISSPSVHYSSNANCRLVMHCQRRPPPNDQSSICQPPCLRLTLACAVFWFCGFLFGGAAYVLARLSMRKSELIHEQRRNKCFGRASIVVSLLGIASGAVIFTLILTMYPSVWMRPISESPNGIDRIDQLPTKTIVTQFTTKLPSVSPCAFATNETCYMFASFFDQSDCQAVSGVVAWDLHSGGLICYHNVCNDYAVDKKCYKHRSTALSQDSCGQYRGLFVFAASGTSCYYNQCPGFQTQRGDCFKFRRSSTRASCSGGYYEHGYCYSNS